MESKLILFVDDDPEVHFVVKQHLKDQCFDVVYVTTVVEAIEELDIHSFIKLCNR